MASAVIGALRVNLGIDSAQFSNGLKQSQSKLASFGALARRAILPITAAATLAAKGIGVAVKSTIHAADAMNEAAQKVGIPIEELSRLKYAAEQAGVSFGGLQTALGALSRNMNTALSGTGAASDAFTKLGISISDAQGNLRPTSDVLNDISNAFAAMADGPEKTALAMTLMGKSGREMVPVLNEGAAALARMKAEASTFSQVFTAEMGANADQFGDNIARLQGAFGNLAARITAEVLPYLAQFTDWLVQNTPAIATFIADVIKLAAAFAQAAVSVGTFVQKSGQEFRALVDMISTIFEALPVRLREIGSEMISGLIAGIKERVGSVISTAKSAVIGVVDAVKKTAGVNSPSTVFADIGRNLMVGLGQGIASRTDQVQGEVESFANTLGQLFTDVLSGATSFGEGLRNIIQQSLSDLGGNLIQTGLSSLFGMLKIPGLAAGGVITTGGLAMVGERGREIVDLPRGATVTPLPDPRRAVSNVHLTVTVNGARGNTEIRQMVAEGVSAGMRQVERRVPGIVADAARRGG